MKNCPNCQTEIEENFDACWKCGYSLVENCIPKPQDISEKRLEIDCLRCRVPMIFSGTIQLHEGAKIGLFGNLFEAFVNREAFDTYVCPGCRKVEFYLPDEK